MEADKRIGEGECRWRSCHGRRWQSSGQPPSHPPRVAERGGASAGGWASPDLLPTAPLWFLPPLRPGLSQAESSLTTLGCSRCGSVLGGCLLPCDCPVGRLSVLCRRHRLCRAALASQLAGAHPRGCPLPPRAMLEEGWGQRGLPGVSMPAGHWAPHPKAHSFGPFPGAGSGGPFRVLCVPFRGCLWPLRQGSRGVGALSPLLWHSC